MNIVTMPNGTNTPSPTPLAIPPRASSIPHAPAARPPGTLVRMMRYAVHTIIAAICMQGAELGAGHFNLPGLAATLHWFQPGQYFLAAVGVSSGFNRVPGVAIAAALLVAACVGITDITSAMGLLRPIVLGALVGRGLAALAEHAGGTP